MTREERARVLQMHRDNGFDLVRYDSSDETYVVQCSQCVVIITQRRACHTLGCPNRIKR